MAEVTDEMSFKETRELFFLGDWDIQSFTVEKKTNAKKQACKEVSMYSRNFPEFESCEILGERYLVFGGGSEKTKWPAHCSHAGTRAAAEEGPPDKSSVWGAAPEDWAQGVT